jgi:hypothetical protein
MRDGARLIVTPAVTVERHANATDRAGPISSGYEAPERALELNRGLHWWMDTLIEWSDKCFGTLSR